MVKAPPDLLVDGHVHLYGCFQPADLLDAAAANFAAHARRAGIEAWRGVLLLTESRKDAVYEELARSGTAKGKPLGAWTVQATEEAESLRLIHRDGRELIVLSGFQVATREDLEVLAIGTTTRVPDGQEFFETYRQVRASGAFPVIPWGFGKWTLQRGQTVRRLIESSLPTDVAFGDNGGRISGLPMPSLLKAAAARGFAILPGTDPLPFADQAARVGTSGFVLRGVEPGVRPAAAIRQALAHAGSAAGYVALTGALSFAVTQARMQIRKRLG
jgi:hypothetical protein